ncbi:MAG TPA: hypothetical protein DCL83_17515, partial [Arthrobacter bacterium]|nr:hypothetical protein [Arthrobacter sp.]
MESVQTWCTPATISSSSIRNKPRSTCAPPTSVRFPPLGLRGAGGTSRAGRWGILPTAAYLASGNEAALCIPQLESKVVIDNVEKIAAINGIDALFVGVADLSMDLGTIPTEPAVIRSPRRPRSRIRL